MSRRLSRWFALVGVMASVTVFAAPDDPPPPPPPPPPLEETGPVETSTDGDWSIKGQNGLLDRSTGHVRKPMLSFFLGVPFGTVYGLGYVGAFNFGVGARFYIPIVKDGFLPMLNDSFGIEFGADTVFVAGGFGYGLGFGLAAPVAEARWNFHIFPKLEAYGKVGVGLGIFFGTYATPYVVYVANVGVLFKVNEVLFLRAEFGSPAVKVGLGLAF